MYLPVIINNKKFLVMRIFSCFLIFLGVLGCTPEPLQFFPANIPEIYERDGSDFDGTYWMKVVVVASPPKHNEEFIKAVDNFLGKNYQIKNLGRKGYSVNGKGSYRIVRIYFLKESWDTDRDFEPWDEFMEYYNIDKNPEGAGYIFNPKDRILDVTWHKGFAKNSYTFRNAYKEGCPSSLVLRNRSKNEYTYGKNCSEKSK